MKPQINKKRILIFIGSMASGGKERRLIELLCYLKNRKNYDFLIIMTKDVIHYPSFYDLRIPYKIIPKVNYTIFYKLYKVCQEYQPHIIHTWGRMQTLYMLPAAFHLKIPLINSQITSAPPKINRFAISRFIDALNFSFSKIILSNSKAGIESFKPPLHKSKVIYNGINLNRFYNLPQTEDIKSKYGIRTPFTVVMSASFSVNKDYNLFYKVADQVTKLRDDVTFIAVGQSHDDQKFNELLERASHNPRIKFPGRINDVEALVNASTIGTLFSVNGEGISNSIMEYMALSKPVIANSEGGTKEIVHHNKNGYLITNETVEQISTLIIGLLQNQKKCLDFGNESRRIIESAFSLNGMGKAFEQTYHEALGLEYKQANPIAVTTI